MKKLIITSLACMFTAFTFGQLTVKSDGYIDANNLKIDGCIGEPGYEMGGVLTLTSSSVNPIYQFIASPRYPLSLVYTCPKERESYAFVNYFNNQLNYYVNSQGMVYTYYGMVTTSDSLQKKNITNLGSSLNKISLLRGVTFDYKDNSPELLSESAVSNGGEETLLGATPQISSQIVSEKSRKRIGLVAQEVEAIFPEVVRTSFDGTKGILYNDLVGVLVEGIKELNDSLRETRSETASLRSEVEELKTMLAGLLRKNAPENNINSDNQSKKWQNEAELHDNTPNPFNQETEIAYRLSSDATTAFIYIYDLDGRLLKKYPLATDSLNGAVIISASEFASGTYIYSLVINNKTINSKRMVLTE